MTTTTENRVLLGEGMLNWSRYERVGDRYGLVHLQTDGIEDYEALEGDARYMQTVPASRYCSMVEAKRREGQRGKLYAEVVATRQSGHIGDLFHGLFPETPEVGEEMYLGHGRLFTEVAFNEGGDIFGVGVEPQTASRKWGSDLRGDRNTFWLDPRMLYRCHEQTVRLWFVPDQGQA